MIFIFIFSFIFTLLIIFLDKKLMLFADDINKTHAVHNLITPKCGGISIFITFCVFSFFYNSHIGLRLILAGTPLFLCGLYEDLKKNTSQIVRLNIMALTTFLAIFLTGFYVDDIGLFKLPYIIAIIFTIFSVVGISSAINFIDGLNGLASGICLIVLIFYAKILYSFGDYELFILVSILICSILGFFVFNFPWGKIFLGDAGAYFLGYLISFISIILVNKYPQISPWYPFTALSYPIIETLVTIKRRLYKKKWKNIPFFQSEKLHLHTLLFKRKIRKNSIATIYLLMFHLCINIFAYYFRTSMITLIAFFVIIVLIYLKWYSAMFITIYNRRK